MIVNEGKKIHNILGISGCNKFSKKLEKDVVKISPTYNKRLLTVSYSSLLSSSKSEEPTDPIFLLKY